MAATVEEQMVVKAIREECPWESLPKRLQSTLHTKEEWHRSRIWSEHFGVTAYVDIDPNCGGGGGQHNCRVAFRIDHVLKGDKRGTLALPISLSEELNYFFVSAETLHTTDDDHYKRIVDYCIRKRLQWNTCFARRVCREGEYYEEMMRYLRRNLALYPYHLADYICRVLRISPFRYYFLTCFDYVIAEQPYDSIPNFTAADALRLTGVGRNEFIDIMNKCRSKKLMWKLNKSIAKELLPTQPVDFPIDPWWGVCLVNFTIEEFKKLSEEETATIDKICKEEANSYVLFDPKVIDGLYKRGLVYFDVPVYPDDRFKVSRLEGFVSNKDQSYEDPIEELLYAVFVVSSANATVAELAATLLADLYQLQAAASFACRLGWAVKLMDADSVLEDTPTFPSNILSDDEEGSNASINSEKSGQQLLSVDAGPRKISGTAHVALVVDANVTSYLMMGSLSPGLKSHAVTLYEAGKLGDSCIAELCSDLASLEGKKFEGVLEEFANHAFSLRCFLECLQSGGVSTNENIDKAGEAKLPTSSLQDNVTANLTKINIEDNDELPKRNHSDLNSSDGNMLTASTTSLESGEGMVRNDVEGSGTTELDGSTDINVVKTKRKYRVDILRCESLASLPAATLERLFLRDYDIIVSMVPLPSSSVLPGPSGPIHFGPPSYSSMTPWMKLVLYTAGNCGPLSAVFMKGQRFRLLPEPLAGCEKALIWSWDSSVLGGLGGKFEGNLVKGNLLLHCLNSMLKQSAILVQPLSINDLNASGNLVTVDIPLPLKSDDQSIASVIARTNLPQEQRCRTEVVGFDGTFIRSYALPPEHDEAATKPISEEQSSTHDGKPDTEDADSKDVVLPGVNLIFDGAELHPFDISACLQARQPLWLIAEASAASSTMI
uniref:FAM91 N-terminal domain-containing protein n=1 Tax=Oryza punctata TaxID=4537 RepID=A0A0E0JHK1_ORYPU